MAAVRIALLVNIIPISRYRNLKKKEDPKMQF